MPKKLKPKREWKPPNGKVALKLWVHPETLASLRAFSRRLSGDGPHVSQSSIAEEAIAEYIHKWE